ncbi:insecticidal delta-endotoxin Cry8Ea1 family protein [Bacillus sp. A17A.1]
MKYKNRKDAKRKYKQTLLATVATMTLGVSTLGSTASAFVEEKDQNVAQQQNTVQPQQGAEHGEPSESELVKLVTAEVNRKSVSKMAATTMAEIIKYGNKGPDQLNDTLRALVMAGADFIPYGGMFVSQLINVMWPTTSNNQLKELRAELIKYVKDAIDDEQSNFLSDDFAAIQKELEPLEKAINTKGSENSDEYTKTQRGTQAKIINSAFNTLLTHAASDKHQITNLPLYTKVALAHLQFLKTLNSKAVMAKINVTDASLKELYQPNGLNNLANQYAEHVNQTYYNAATQLMTDLRGTTKFGEVIKTLRASTIDDR